MLELATPAGPDVFWSLCLRDTHPFASNYNFLSSGSFIHKSHSYKHVQIVSEEHRAESRFKRWSTGIALRAEKSELPEDT